MSLLKNPRHPPSPIPAKSDRCDLFWKCFVYLVLVLSTQMVLIETVVTGFVDEFPVLGKNACIRLMTTIGVCIVFFFGGLAATCQVLFTLKHSQNIILSPLSLSLSLFSHPSLYCHSFIADFCFLFYLLLILPECLPSHPSNQQIPSLFYLFVTFLYYYFAVFSSPWLLLIICTQCSIRQVVVVGCVCVCRCDECMYLISTLLEQFRTGVYSSHIFSSRRV